MKKGNLGFTLVELIIVIAILAILSTGAIAGYSVYVKQANMTADKALVAEIENLLTLAMYNGELTDSTSAGILVLNKDGITYNGEAIQSGSGIDTVLKNAYGENYADALKLKYDGWNAGHLGGLTKEYAEHIAASSYISGNRADKLLSDVEGFTNMAANLANAMNSTISTGTSLAGLYGADLLNQTAAQYGISGPEGSNPTVDDWNTWSADHPQEFSNLLVLATAVDSNNLVNGGTQSQATQLVTAFSQYYAFAATCPDFSQFLDSHMEALNRVTSPSEGANWFNTLQNEAAKSTYVNNNSKTFNQYLNDKSAGESNTDATNDTIVFALIMSALSNASAEDVSADIGNANLFTDGAVKDMYDQYLTAIDAMTKATGDISIVQGDIAVIYNAADYSVSDTMN